MQRDDRMYFFVPCYRGLEYPWILVSAWILEPMPRRYQGATKFLGSQKLYADFYRTGGRNPNPCIVQGSPVVEGKTGELLEAQVMKGLVCRAESVVF